MTVVEDAVCTFCACLCDDLVVEVRDGRVVVVGRACARGRAHIFRASAETPGPTVAGRPASLAEALDEAACILSGARYPLVYGLATVSAEAQKEAIALAELIGGTIDTTDSHCWGTATVARQQVGLAACSLAEVRNRADLILFWGCDPLTVTPRLLARFCARARGEPVPGGGEGRKLVVVDVRPTPTARVADELFLIAPGSDYEVLSVLRALVRGRVLGPGFGQGEYGGVPWRRWAALAESMRRCRCGVVFFGRGLTGGWCGQASVELLLVLVRELNAYTRFYAVPLRRWGNAVGVESVLAWQTGFPFAVNFSAGYPRFGPVEFSAAEMLARREVDACLVVGADPAAHLPRAAVAHLASIPVILLDSRRTSTAALARVVIPVAPGGVGAAGTFYRLDNVPLRAGKLVDLPLLSDEQVLRSLRERISRAQDQRRHRV